MKIYHIQLSKDPIDTLIYTIALNHTFAEMLAIFSQTVVEFAGLCSWCVFYDPPIPQKPKKSRLLPHIYARILSHKLTSIETSTYHQHDLEGRNIYRPDLYRRQVC